VDLVAVASDDETDGRTATGATPAVSTRTGATPAASTRTGATPVVAAAQTGATPVVTARTGATPVVPATAEGDASSSTGGTSTTPDGTPLRVSTGVVPAVGRRTGATPVVRVATGVTPVVGAPEVVPTPSDEPDRLLLDLAERLWRHGLVVEVDHGIPGGTRIPMVVGHPDAPGELLVAVLTDDDAYVAEPSIRVRERLMADRLERLGWSVLRVWSAAAFLDPQAEVDRIRRAVHARVPAPATPRTAPLVLGVPDAIVETDEPEELPSATGATPTLPPATDGTPTVDGATPPVRVTTGVIPAVRSATGATPAVPPATDATLTVPAATGATPAVTTGSATGATAVVPTSSTADAGDASTSADGPTDDGKPARPVQLALAVPTRPRPDVRSGLPIGAYSDDQLDELVGWLMSDGEDRTRDQLGAALRKELGITRRSYRVDTAVRSAITRALR